MKNWDEFLERESKEDYFISLMEKVNQAYETETVYPPKEEIFSCFDLCPYQIVKVVIIGQDPYHGAGQAHGLSFSVKPGVKVPPSLRNIYKELKTDLDIDAPKHGYLASWAKQGVLMMNTGWTVSEGKAGSHKKIGWTKFAQRILEVLNDYDKPIVFILWGNHAIDAAKGITNPKHFLLKSAHPSPLAGGGFFGSRPFSQTNALLEKAGRGAIDWQIADHVEIRQHFKIKLRTMSMCEIESVVEQSIRCIDKSSLSLQEKRNYIYSLYEFQSLFDTSHTSFRVEEILYKYHYLFRLPIEVHPNKEEIKARIESEGGNSFWMRDDSLVQLEEQNQQQETVFYCEAGSEIWRKLIETNILEGDDALPVEEAYILDLINHILLLAKEKNRIAVAFEWYATLFYIVTPDNYYDLSEEDLPKLKEIRNNIFYNEAIYPFIGDTDLIANNLEYLMKCQHEHVQFMLAPYIKWLAENE